MNHKIDRTTNLTFYERIENFYIKACEAIKKKNKHIFVKPDWKVKYAVPIDVEQTKDLSKGNPMGSNIVLYSNGVKHIMEKKEKYTISLQCIFSLKHWSESDKFDGLIFIDYRRKWTSTTNELDSKKTSMNWSQDIPLSFVHSREYMKHVEYVEQILENIVRDYIRFQIISGLDDLENDSKKVLNNSKEHEFIDLKKPEPADPKDSKEPELIDSKEPELIDLKDPDLIELNLPELKPKQVQRKISCFFDEPSKTPVQESPVHFFTERPFSFTPIQTAGILVRTNSFDFVKDKTSSTTITRGESKTNLDTYCIGNDMVTIPRELYNLLVKLSNETLQKIDSLVLEK